VHRIPGEITGTYNVLASDLSPSGRRLLVIHAKGRNLKTTDVSVRVRRVPRMVSAFDPGSDFRNDNFVGATALAHHHAVLLLNRFETPLVSIGKAGHRFSTPTALPNPDGLIFVLGGITHDTATGDVVVVETAVNQHILGSVTGAYVWTRSTDGTWSDPVQVAPAGYAARAVTAFAGKVSVAVTSRVGDPNTGDTVLSTVDRSAGGTWSPPVRIPHARFGTFDGVVMTTNAATGSIHVAYTGDSGIVHRARVKGVWHGRHVLAGRFTTPLALAVTPHGKPILGYDQH
jgi:hypothetical protein